MPVLADSAYRPPFIFWNGHVQTVYPTLFRPAPVAFASSRSENIMKKALLYATAFAFALSLGGGLTSSPAFAQDAAKKVTAAECKKMADPKAKDDCMKQVNAQAKKAKTAKTAKKAKTVKKAAPKS